MRTPAVLITFLLSFFPTMGRASFETCARIVRAVPARVSLNELRPRPPLIIIDGASYRVKPGESAASTYAELASGGYLISQNDPRLEKRGLIVPGGGLCASTCGINVMHALLALAGADTRELYASADQKLALMVAAARDQFGLDARQGLNLGYLKRILADVALKRGISLSIEHVVSYPQFEITLDALNPRPNELVIVAIQSGVDDNREYYHALVILSADSQTGLITYSNPNQPNEIRFVVSEPAYNMWGSVAPRMAFVGGHSADRFTGVIQEYIKLSLR